MAEIKRSQTPVTNPQLIQAMDAMKQEKNQRTESVFVNTLKVSRFLVPVNVSTVQQAQANPDGTVELKDQQQIGFILFNTQAGEKFFPLFTDISEVNKWPEHDNRQLAAITYRDVCEFFRREQNNPNAPEKIIGIVINPYSQNIMIPTESMMRIMNTEAITPGTKIQIGDFKEKPQELLDAISDYLKDQETVTKAFLRVMKREDKPNPNFLLVLDVDVDALGNDGVKALFDGVAEAAKPHLRGVELAIAPASNNFGAAALREAMPFYVK